MLTKLVNSNGYFKITDGGEMEKVERKVMITESENTLITGVSGFVGKHLVDYIITNFPETAIHGLVRWRSESKEELEGKKVQLHLGDLNDLTSLRKIISDVRPDPIFHLAAQSYVDMSFLAPADTLKTNVIGTCNLLQAIKDIKEVDGYDPTVHICSSSEVYGQVKHDELPIKETNVFRPASPYAVSKVGEDMLALQYYLSWGIKTIRTRSFTHTGPGRGEVFALSSFSKQIADIEAGKQHPILSVGNLDSVRTICDVRDMVRAYWMLTEYCDPGDVYNIGGADTMTIGEALDLLLSLTDAKIDVEPCQSRMRPSDVTLQLPDTTKFQEKTGWEPEFTTEQTLKDMLDYWRHANEQ